MVHYEVTVYTGNLAFSGTFENIFIKLVGTNGDSGQHKLHKLGHCFHRGDVSTFTVSSLKDIGKLTLIQLWKKSCFTLLKHSWFPAKFVIKSPSGDIYNFPIYHWIIDDKVHSFWEGKALLNPGNSKEWNEDPKKIYRWSKYALGIPYCIMAKDVMSLPPDDRFSFTKIAEFDLTAIKGMMALGLTELAECKSTWTSFHDIERLCTCHRTEIAEYVRNHWMEDSFFGYQLLNGMNPMLIRCCRTLPNNFPVIDSMVFPDGCYSLNDEMKNGNIFLCDYKVFDGVKANIIKGKQQYLMAPLVLLHKTPDEKLIPIAIQLKQAAAANNPIFTPSDSECDWMLAKIFVRNADFSLHELNSHLLHTHLLAEVFTVALLRNIPTVHPLYKLLIPHTRYTLQINIMARNFLISKNGIFTQFACSGGKALLPILQRSLSSLTYRSLCIPDDIEDRGLKQIPNFYYRDDGLKLWNIIHSFVKSVLSYYYKKDTDVQQDTILKNWIQDIFEHGFLSNKDSKIPEKFTNLDDLVKFVVMVIFTCSAQHSAVNSGQYDYGSWLPNAPSTMKRPPPTKKGTVTEAMILKALPDIKTTVHVMATVWLLSTVSSDARFLGDYPDERFTEKVPCLKIKEFQEELKKLSEEIQERNKSLDVPYTYLDPKMIENSVSI